MLYALIGVVIFWLCFVIVDKITPYDLWREIVEKQNRALAWWWRPCAWGSASSWRRRSTDPALSSPAASPTWPQGKRGAPTALTRCAAACGPLSLPKLPTAPMPTLDWLNRAAAFTTAAQVPYRLLEPSAPMAMRSAPPTTCSSRATTSKRSRRCCCFYRGGEMHLYRPALHQKRLRALRRQPGAQPVAQHDAAALQLLRELLSEDGSIWVTIDDNEGITSRC